MQQNRQIVEEAFDRWSKGQGSILDLIDDDGIIVIPGTVPHCGAVCKRDFAANVATPFMSRFSKPPVPRPSTIMADGDEVIVIADAEGTTLDGKAYRNNYVFLLTFRESRLVKATEFLDLAAFNVVWDSVLPNTRGGVANETLEYSQVRTQ